MRAGLAFVKKVVTLSQTKTKTRMIVLANAFSLGMLPSLPATLRVEEIPAAEVAALLRNGFQSAIGHAATAQVLTTLLGVEVSVNRVAVTLQPGDTLIVFQLQGRLEEGRVLSAEEVQALPHRFMLVRLRPEPR